MQDAPDLYLERHRARISQNELAEHLGVSRQTVNNWEKRPATLPLHKINRYLHGVATLADVKRGES